MIITPPPFQMEIQLVQLAQAHPICHSDQPPTSICQKHQDSNHEKTRQVAREFLNDWEAIWTVLEHPDLPLTNNIAKRALRHWVITRKISYGTRTQQGSRAFALLASVIETCRQRQVSPWTYLAEVIAERRKGNPVLSLPVPAG